MNSYDLSLDFALFNHMITTEANCTNAWRALKPLADSSEYNASLKPARVARFYYNQHRSEAGGRASQLTRGYAEQWPLPRHFGRRDLLAILHRHAARLMEAFVSQKSAADDAAFECALHYMEEMR